jgi:hypothetical protein
LDTFRRIVGDGKLVCDAEVVRRGGTAVTIGMSRIKERRLKELEVTCHPGTLVGDYVPFYFCPRSIMLFVIYKGNSPDLAYRGGQGPIVHLEADLHEVVEWARARKRKWAFSLSNAGAYYTQFRSALSQLDELDWAAIAATDFRSRSVAESKQAEFLVHRSFPFGLVERIGVLSRSIEAQVEDCLSGMEDTPSIERLPSWYFPA